MREGRRRVIRRNAGSDVQRRANTATRLATGVVARDQRQHLGAAELRLRRGGRLNRRGGGVTALSGHAYSFNEIARSNLTRPERDNTPVILMLQYLTYYYLCCNINTFCELSSKAHLQSSFILLTGDMPIRALLSTVVSPVKNFLQKRELSQ